MSLFRDKVAVVTGGGSGLGRALCEELARRGAVSVVTDISQTSAAETAESITAAGGRAEAVELDVTQAAEVRAAVDGVVARHGRIDYMFNNAGIIILGELRDMDPVHWSRILNVNLFGVLHGTAAAYTHMVKQSHGHIVNVASISGLIPMPTYTAYAASKHAVVGFSNSLRPEAARLGVKVSTVCPGTMKTGLGAAGTILRADRQELEKRAGSRDQPMDPGEAARITLRGVERNQAMIVFPFSARLLWWAYRIWPALLSPLDTHFVKTLSAARTEG